MAEPILTVTGLSCGFHTEDGFTRVVDGVSYELNAGETLGLVGESGCGKTVSALAVMGLLPKPAGVVEHGEILLKGERIIESDARSLKAVRGKRIGMIFQEPMTALNPVHRIGKQLMEAIDLYEPEVYDAARSDRAIELLEQVGIPAPAQRLREYPHQLSGGMRQRVMIAMALAGNPDVLIADEPTTALDVTVQAQILELIEALQRTHGMAVIFITHDLGVVAQLCDKVPAFWQLLRAEESDGGGTARSAYDSSWFRQRPVWTKQRVSGVSLRHATASADASADSDGEACRTSFPRFVSTLLAELASGDRGRGHA